MPPYPFQQAPRFAEFLERAKELGVEIKESSSNIAPGRERVTYLSRSGEGKTYYYPLTFASDDERVQWTTIRMVCHTLKLDPSHFGLHLDSKPQQS